MVADMKPGSVIVDLAVEPAATANCRSRAGGRAPRREDRRLTANVPSRSRPTLRRSTPATCYNFVTPAGRQGDKALKIDWDDDHREGTLLIRDGKVVHPGLAPRSAAAGRAGRGRPMNRATDRDG
jgi:H+-translocating NAD(P) transhydrogenase subunit alpha